MRAQSRCTAYEKRVQGLKPIYVLAGCIIAMHLNNTITGKLKIVNFV